MWSSRSRPGRTSPRPTGPASTPMRPATSTWWWATRRSSPFPWERWPPPAPPLPTRRGTPPWPRPSPEVRTRLPVWPTWISKASIRRCSTPRSGSTSGPSPIRSRRPWWPPPTTTGCPSYCAADPDRLFGAAMLPCRTRRRQRGSCGGPSTSSDSRRHSSDPIRAWDAHCRTRPTSRCGDVAEELGVPIAIHEGSSVIVPTLGSDRPFNPLILHAVSHSFEEMLACAQLMAFGTLERHPDLQIVFLESGGGWVPFWLERLDEQFETFGGFCPGDADAPQRVLRPPVRHQLRGRRGHPAGSVALHRPRPGGLGIGLSPPRRHVPRGGGGPPSHHGAAGSRRTGADSRGQRPADLRTAVTMERTGRGGRRLLPGHHHARRRTPSAGSSPPMPCWTRKARSTGGPRRSSASTTRGRSGSRICSPARSLPDRRQPDWWWRSICTSPARTARWSTPSKSGRSYPLTAHRGLDGGGAGPAGVGPTGVRPSAVLPMGTLGTCVRGTRTCNAVGRPDVWT